MAAPVNIDRAWENAVVSGTGTVSLSGSAQFGYQNFVNAGTGATVYYNIYDPQAGAWESGWGTYTITSSPAGTLTRNVLASSNSNALVNFVGNPCNIQITLIAARQNIGYGFSNLVVETSGTSATWTVPTAIQIPGTPFKVTVIGGGGQGGGSNTTAGQIGAGGGSGGVNVIYLAYVSGQTTATYTVGPGGSGAAGNAAGNGGTASTFIYNSVTYTAGAGSGGTIYSTGTGGTGGTVSGGTLNLAGNPGGAGGTMAATSNYEGDGGDTPLGWGQGGKMPNTAAGAVGSVGTGYGAGGSGGRSGTGTTARAGGAGAGGIILIEY
jgi:hypothetical protein